MNKKEWKIVGISFIIATIVLIIIYGFLSPIIYNNGYNDGWDKGYNNAWGDRQQEQVSYFHSFCNGEIYGNSDYMIVESNRFDFPNQRAIFYMNKSDCNDVNNKIYKLYQEETAFETDWEMEA